MNKPSRIHVLDTLRGACVLVMIVYHGLWTLQYLFGVYVPWFNGTGAHVVQKVGASTFIILAGFCWSLGRNPLRRGLQVFGAGCVVSLVTLIVMPESAVIWGVLTFLGASMLLLCLLEPGVKHIHPWWGLAGCLLAFECLESLTQGVIALVPLWSWAVPQGLYANYITTFFGFPFPAFHSTDYFAFLPWFPLFLGGYFLSRVGLNLPTGQPSPLTKPLRFLGRHSLVIYMVHQPVLYGLLWLIFEI